MKIGIMGGTFDPIHIGHLLLGEFAFEQFNLDEIWFLPNGNPPHKDTEEMDTSLQHRVEMVKSAIHGSPHFKLSLHEAREGVHSYTYQTMLEFHKLYPGSHFYFILGADSLFSIEKWRYFKEIFPVCTILAAMRDDKDVKDMKKQITHLKNTYGADIELLMAPLLEISSTTIRERATQGLTVHYMVPDAVADYIKKHHLYTQGN
jgi:nicotinate-nucleotide adenylyltransferase